jgi:chemotaxis response regulator CheB
MRVAIVNDSVLAREVIRRSVLVRPDVTIAWVATNGAEAVEWCCKDRPDLILMDLVMPEVDGVAATAQIMRSCPCPILIVTVSINRNTTPAFAAMSAGAIDVMALPADWRHGNELLQKISQIERLHHPLPFRSRPRRPFSTAPDPGMPLILIGASAGGPAALAELLGSLPREFAAGIVLAQHLDARFADEFICWLQKQTPLREAGHLTIAQDETSSALYGMPRAAARLGAAREVLPLARIAPRLKTFAG